MPVQNIQFGRILRFFLVHIFPINIYDYFMITQWYIDVGLKVQSFDALKTEQIYLILLLTPRPLKKKKRSKKRITVIMYYKLTSIPCSL